MGNKRKDCARHDSCQQIGRDCCIDPPDRAVRNGAVRFGFWFFFSFLGSNTTNRLCGHHFHSSLSSLSLAFAPRSIARAARETMCASGRELRARFVRNWGSDHDHDQDHETDGPGKQCCLFLDGE